MRRVASAVCVLWLCLAPLGTAFAVDVIIVGGLSREATVEPGTELQGKILVRNEADEVRQVKIYQTDYLFSADGTTNYATAGTCTRSNASWISFSPQQVSIPPDEMGTVYYTIRTPEPTGLVGTYWSMLMVEPLSDESPELLPDEDGKPRVAVRTVMRYGIQMVTHIGKTGDTKVQFGSKQLLVSESQRVLQIDVENTGERSVNPFVWAELYDADGASLGRFDSHRIRIYPTCSARFQVDLSDVPPGTYNALIVADNGDENVFGVQSKLEIK